MSSLQDFADWFKARKTKIRAWYEDGVGRFAFKVVVDGQAFVCAARTSSSSTGETSVMKKVAGRAQTQDALIALRLADGTYVFDPVTVLGTGDCRAAKADERKERGEEWVYFDVSHGCGFEEWFDGYDSPAVYRDVMADGGY